MKKIELRRDIASLYKEGVSKKEIYERLKDKYEDLDSDYIALLTASVVPEGELIKYKKELSALKLLMLFSTLLVIYFPAPAPGLLRYAVLAALIGNAFYLIVQFKYFNAYYLVGFNNAAYLFFFLLLIRGILLVNPLVIISCVIPAGAIFYNRLLRKRLIPHIPLRGRIKKDPGGEYVFE